MAQLPAISSVQNGPTATMSSLELVDFINAERRDGEANLRHDDFLRKVPKVLGEEDARKFSGIYKDPMNRAKPCYHFPKREACLMAMSYSYDIQAKVFDRMTELENRAAAPALPTSYIEALEHLLEAKKAEQAAIARADEAIRTKALIGSKREATAMATASKAVKRANQLQLELDQSRQFASVKRMEDIHKRKFPWLPLRKASREMGIDIRNVFDANYGHVNAYHTDVWMRVYGVEV